MPGLVPGWLAAPAAARGFDGRGSAPTAPAASLLGPAAPLAAAAIPGIRVPAVLLGLHWT
jgi:hypothetical protein